MSETFRLAYVPGATPGKWARVWRERLPDVALELVQVDPADAPAALRDGRADAAIARLPVDTDVFSRIPLYEEIPVVCVHRDHFLAALEPDEAVAPADLADETVWLPRDDVLYRVPGDRLPGSGTTAGSGGSVAGAGGSGADAAPVAVPGRAPVDPDGVPLERPATAAGALALVGAAAGITVLPMSLARLHHRKDVVYRPLDDGPTAPVGLVWPIDRTTDLVEEMIGIVRGRTVNSSRGSGRSRSSGDGGASPSGSSAADSSASGRARGHTRGAKAGDRTSGRASGRGRDASRGRGRSQPPNQRGRNKRRKDK
ncbi:LysR substrate-binding domain-containing protein [Myceligenerans pegani]|uniref:LysR substrate-binding domain-containing protein n=1 Tax=Myceligenerans pegani TaxID=2776917 RepID=UPI00299E59AA|nr:LysR substrate-binding domain-containing protein [Myceligenerans sp. TRM 65318]